MNMGVCRKGRHFFIEPISADLSVVYPQMIPAVTSQGNRPLNANKQHMGAYRKGGVALQRWGGNAKTALKTQRLFIILHPKRKVVTAKFHQSSAEVRSKAKDRGTSPIFRYQITPFPYRKERGLSCYGAFCSGYLVFKHQFTVKCIKQSK